MNDANSSALNSYFRDREYGARARTEHEVSPVVWAAIVAAVQGLTNSGAFGLRFPERCPDGQGICGCDADAVGAAVAGEMPGLAWPLQVTQDVEVGFMRETQAFAPDTGLVLDFVEFVHASVAKPAIVGSYHEYFRHHHLTFDQYTGQEEFRATVNRLFARNGLAYEMPSDGRIVRVLPGVIGDELKRTTFNSGDRTLDVMLEECRVKFMDRDPLVRREGLERLWDAWERLKSLADVDKRRSIEIILQTAAPEPAFRARLEADARQLTEIGNSHLIRHHEVAQIAVTDVDQVDYLFHRLFAMITLLLRRRGRP